MAQIEQWYQSMPPVTRTYVTLSVLTTGASALDWIHHLKLHMDWRSVIYRYQVWRLFTNFFFFGQTISISFVFKMFFLYRYSKLLEINSFQGRTADYVFMLLFGGVLCLLLATYLNTVYFFGESLTTMIVYVWGRKNERLAMNFLGLFSFRAPYLAWVFLIFNVVFNQLYVTDLIGIGIGHIYFYLTDVYPVMPGGRRFLRTPKILLQVMGNNDDFGAAQQIADEMDRAAAGAAAAAAAAAAEDNNVNNRGWGQGRDIARNENPAGDDGHQHMD